MVGLRGGTEYRERHGKFTLITCFLFLIIIGSSGFYIVNYAMDDSNNKEVPKTDYEVSYQLYSTEYNVSGKLTIYSENDEIFQVLEVLDGGIAGGVKLHPEGTYKVYYLGDTNGVNFGPVEYTISSYDTLLIDRVYVGVRLTIMTL